VGVPVDVMGHTSMKWRHWGCESGTSSQRLQLTPGVTEKVLKNMKGEFDDAKDLDGCEWFASCRTSS
jgi:hypothetical protein